ncbi:MAG: beta-ketoacyl-[acyl-carrier-protein] synthase family protein [Verrucomicrobiota bacterium]|nr:beta-ketoacyl-[acyl-carrier-protein] synthase family protein [Verrucomicrobiota bacterium]
MSRSSHSVAITAAGIVSPLGRGLDATGKSLRIGRDCITPVTEFDVGKCRAKTAGKVAESEIAAGADRKSRRLHRSSRMMIAAAQELFAGDRDFKPELAVIGTTSGGMSFGEAFYRSTIGEKNGGRKNYARWLANYSPQKPVLDAMEAVGFPAPAQIIANACASGTNAIGHGFQLIRDGLCERVLCGGYDAISEMVFVGFDSLQASTPEKCRPFDRERTGLVLGEGAALVALENWEAARKRNAPILGRITGYGISTDNHHLTQPHPSGIGPQQAMERALASAQRSGTDADYINAHGTATLFNDATEGIAISNLCPGVPVSSTKSMMGHSLGAAGAIEAVFCLLAIRDQFLPPNINFRDADPVWTFDLVANQARDAEVNCVLSNSFGFGGTNATIVLERDVRR